MVGFEPAAYDGGSYRSVLHYFPLQHRKLSAVFDFGQTLFAFMTEATSSAMGSIIESAPLVKKIRINKMIFPVEKSYVCAGKLHSDGVVLSNRGGGFSNGSLTVSPVSRTNAQAFTDLAWMSRPAKVVVLFVAKPLS